MCVYRDWIQRQQLEAAELADRKFFIPAVRTLMGAMYDAKYLQSSMKGKEGLSSHAEIIKILEINRDNIFDQIIEDLHQIVFLRDLRPSQQLFSQLVAVIPEAKRLSVGNLKKTTDINFKTANGTTEFDLVLAPTEFDFDPTSNTVAYLTSMVKAVAVLELIPQMLSIMSQRIVSELYQVTEKCLAEAARAYRCGMVDSSILNVLSTNMINLNPTVAAVSTSNMSSKGNDTEFEAFVPILRNLCGNLFGQLLTVANCIRLIGETTRQIVNESGVPVDIHSFYKNCLSAIHGEMKNFMACLLHGGGGSGRKGGGVGGGGGTGMRTFTNSTVAISEALKGGKGLTNQRVPLFQFVNTSDPQDLAGIIDPVNILGRKEEQSARKLASMLAVDPFSDIRQNTGHELVVKPNLHYITVIYRPFSQFEDWLRLIYKPPSAEEIKSPASQNLAVSNATVKANKSPTSPKSPTRSVKTESSSPGSGSVVIRELPSGGSLNMEELLGIQYVDSTFLESVLGDEYIPVVENNVMQELTRAFLGPDAILWHPLIDPDQTLAIGRGSNSILSCVATFIGLLCQVVAMMHQIPASQNECEQLLLNLMSAFLEKCEAKFKGKQA